MIAHAQATMSQKRSAKDCVNKAGKCTCRSFWSFGRRPTIQKVTWHLENVCLKKTHKGLGGVPSGYPRPMKTLIYWPKWQTCFLPYQALKCPAFVWNLFPIFSNLVFYLEWDPKTKVTSPKHFSVGSKNIWGGVETSMGGGNKLAGAKVTSSMGGGIQKDYGLAEGLALGLVLVNGKKKDKKISPFLAFFFFFCTELSFLWPIRASINWCYKTIYVVLCFEVDSGSQHLSFELYCSSQLQN